MQVPCVSCKHSRVQHNRITHNYKATLNPDLVCMGADKQTHWWLLVAGCVVVTLVLVVYRW